MDWEALSAISTAFTGGVIVVTVLVGIYQLRQLRDSRRDAAAIELMRSLQDTTFAHAFRLIFSLPEGITSAEFHAAGAEFEEAAQILAFRFETLGLLVYRGTIAFELMEELVGGAVVSIWNRLSGLIQETREKGDYPIYCEWFQWIAEQFEARGRPQQVPAYVRLKSWRPR